LINIFHYCFTKNKKIIIFGFFRSLDIPRTAADLAEKNDFEIQGYKFEAKPEELRSERYKFKLIILIYFCIFIPVEALLLFIEVISRRLYHDAVYYVPAIIYYKL
jgi:hypothetical protein